MVEVYPVKKDGALANCLALHNGAHFLRGDLHIHSYPASHDVTDETMLPAAIVQTAKNEGLQIIAVADHNEISNVQATVDAGAALGVLVIPAIELSTPEGHLLCYFPNMENLSRFYSRLDILDHGLPNSRCTNSMMACLDLTQSLDGFCVLAHVDGGNGLETKNPGGSPHKIDILCHRALLAIELQNAVSVVSYSDDDSDGVRKSIGRQRISRLGLGERQFLSRILSSDSHKLLTLGKNARLDQKLTRYKMAAPTFQGLRHSLEEGDSRIRLEEEVPTTTPYILGIAISGGFLNEQIIHFNSNLNCIIGGRGTGKSTAFEAVRCLTGNPSDADVVDSEVWPQKLNLFWRDEAGQHHSLSRGIGEAIVNDDDSNDGPIAFEIDCFGQGEAGKIREQSKSDPLALMRYLDAFTSVKDQLHTEKERISILRDLRTEIEKAENQIEKIVPIERTLSVIRQQLTTFESANGSEVIKLRRSLANEQALRININSQLGDIATLLNEQSVIEALSTLEATTSDAEIEIGKTELAEISTEIKNFSIEVAKAALLVSAARTKLQNNFDDSIKKWVIKERPVREEIEAKRKELEAKNIPLDMGHINKLTQQEAQYVKELETLKRWGPVLVRLKGEYTLALEARLVARKAVSQLRQSYAIKASRALAEVLSDLQVKLQYIESGHSDEAVTIIASAMNWRTVNHFKAAAILTGISLTGLLNALRKSDHTELLKIEVKSGVKLFSVAEAKEIILKLQNAKMIAALEVCEVDDPPKLTVTRKMETAAGVKFLQKEFSQLSLGQQQSVMLALILSSDSKRPLIIDQPEDNLDSEFIFHTFVPVLRRAKERRQVIIVTHNANIAVLGDAEQLVVFKSNSNHSLIVARGSIDDSAARDAACKILEGAKEAFSRRARIYGIS